jgi:hypothetical protein
MLPAEIAAKRKEVAMRHDDVRYAVAAREDGLRRVKKLTLTIGSAGAACCAVLFAAFGHSAARSNSAVSSTSGSSAQANGTGSGSQGSGSAGSAGSQTGGSGSPGASSANGSQGSGGSVQAPAQAPAQAPPQAPPQSVSGGT